MLFMDLSRLYQVSSTAVLALFYMGMQGRLFVAGDMLFFHQICFEERKLAAGGRCSFFSIRPFFY